MEKKEKQAVYYFLGWLIVGFLICIIGINDVFALNVNSEYVKFFDNYGTSLSEVTTSKVSSPKTYWTAVIPKLIANSNGGAIIIQTDTPLAKGVNYSLSINLIIYSSDGTTVYNPAISSKFNLGIGTGVQLTKDSYINNTGTEIISKEKTGNYIYYNFTTKTNGSYILVPFTTETSCNNGCIVEYFGYDLISNGLPSELTSSDITNITNSQTNELNNSIQNSTDTITGEIDDMEQTIVDSNKETQDVIKDQLSDCRPSYNLFNENLYVQSSTEGYDLSELEVGKTYTISINSNPSDKTYGFLVKISSGGAMTSDMWEGYTKKNISFTYTQAMRDNNYKLFIISLPSYGLLSKDEILQMKIQINEGSFAQKWEPYGEEICTNKIDETNDQLGNLNDSLNDSNIDGSLNGAGNFFDSFQSTDHGGLSGIITAPLVAINEMLNTTCNPMTATFKGKQLSLPCGYEFWNKLGAIQDFLNVVLGGMLCYNIVKKLFKLIERIKNPEDDRIEVMDL